MSTGRVGHPLNCVKIRVEDWEEGGYSVEDEVVRGELVVGCPWTAQGYFEMEEKTREGFFDEDEMRRGRKL